MYSRPSRCHQTESDIVCSPCFPHQDIPLRAVLLYITLIEHFSYERHHYIILETSTLKPSTTCSSPAFTHSAAHVTPKPAIQRLDLLWQQPPQRLNAPARQPLLATCTSTFQRPTSVIHLSILNNLAWPERVHACLSLSSLSPCNSGCYAYMDATRLEHHHQQQHDQLSPPPGWQ